MKITKNDIRQAILEALNENPEQTVAAPKGDVNSAEQGIAKQVYDFILQLAAEEGMDLNTKRPIIQKVIALLQARLKSDTGEVALDRTRMTGQAAGAASKASAVAAAKPQVQTEGCGDPQLPAAQPSPQMSSGYDQDESQMAKSQLYRTAEYASELEQMIQDGEELDAWVQAKITKASDYLSSVKHYLQYKKTKGDQ